jgi:hypothetical protein
MPAQDLPSRPAPEPIPDAGFAFPGLVGHGAAANAQSHEQDADSALVPSLPPVPRHLDSLHAGHTSARGPGIDRQGQDSRRAAVNKVPPEWLRGNGARATRRGTWTRSEAGAPVGDAGDRATMGMLSCS